jgi:hypothetical protein
MATGLEHYKLFSTIQFNTMFSYMISFLSIDISAPGFLDKILQADDYLKQLFLCIF